VALGQTYFAVQTRRQEMADDEALKEDKMRLLLRAEMKKHNKNLAGVAKQSGVIAPLGYPRWRLVSVRISRSTSASHR
jgi:DNA-damage-inducible protein D